VLSLNKRWILYAAALVLVITVSSLFLFICEVGQIKLFSDNAGKSYLIQKSIFWAVVAISVFILLLLAKAIIPEKSSPDNQKIFEATLNATNDGILIIDNDSHVLKANDPYLKMWDLPYDISCSNNEKTYMSFIKKQLKDPEAFEAWVNFGCESHVVRHYTTCLKDGKIIDVSYNPLSDKGNTIGRVWSFRDITAQINAEYELQKSHENIKLIMEDLEYDKIKTEFFANISHEVKTPLNIIIGTLQLIELSVNNENDKAVFDKLEKYTAIMRQNCYRLLRTLNNLIYITEIDSGSVEMYTQNNDIAEIVKNIASAVKKFVERKGINLDLNIEPDSLITACDADKIERVLLNLISNAVKFTGKGGKISVSLYEKDEYVYILVKDTGIGIPDEMKDFIFQRFRQIDKSFTRKCEGSGIGLYLVRSLVEMHGGTIEVKSEYGKGSEFIVKLPLRLLEDDETAATAEDASSVCVDRVNIEFSDIY